MKKYLPQQKGFVILFTILISTIILMIGLGIFSIATRETVLSSTAREAQYAFYAADTGVECGLYAQAANVLISGGGQFECGSGTVQVDGAGQYPGLPFTFNVLVDEDQRSCAKVTIFDTTTSSGAFARRIISQGYNICDTSGQPLIKNPILVERDLDVLYELGGSVVPTDPTTGASLNGVVNTITTSTIPLVGVPSPVLGGGSGAPVQGNQ